MATKTLTKIYSPIEETLRPGGERGHFGQNQSSDQGSKPVLLGLSNRWDGHLPQRVHLANSSGGTIFHLFFSAGTGQLATHTQSSRVVHWKDAGGDGDVDDGLTSGGTRHGTGRLNFYSKLYFFQALAITCTVFSCCSSAHDTNRQRFWHSL